jgi:hypothetical protein
MRKRTGIVMNTTFFMKYKLYLFFYDHIFFLYFNYVSIVYNCVVITFMLKYMLKSSHLFDQNKSSHSSTSINANFETIRWRGPIWRW